MSRGDLSAFAPQLHRTARHRLSASRQNDRGHSLWPHLSRTQKINFSTVFAGQAVGTKEVDDGIWLVTFMHYDLGYIDLEEKTLQPLNNPFGP